MTYTFCAVLIAFMDLPTVLHNFIVESMLISLVYFSHDVIAQKQMLLPTVRG